MGKIFVISKLTRKAAFRYKIVFVMIILLILCVLLLPAIIKHDGTARGMVQIVLAYTLTLVTLLMGIMTLWLGAATLAKDIEEATIQLVDVKPIPRWQIWIGKLIGILQINGILLIIAGLVIYVQLLWRTNLMPQSEQQVLKDEVFVARSSVKPSLPDITERVEMALKARLAQEPDLANEVDIRELKKLITEQVKATFEIIPPGYARRWIINMGKRWTKINETPLYLRVKFYAAQRSPRQTFLVEWRIGPPGAPNLYQELRSHAPESYQEFRIPAGLIDNQGRLIVEARNPNEITLSFPLEDGIEVLYKEGGFILNYIRGLFIIFCWLTLIGAIALACGSYLSFPTATFATISLLFIAFSTGTINYIIETGSIIGINPNTGRVDNPTFFDHAIVSFFKGLLFLINLVRGFSPIDYLSTGRSIGWGLMLQAFIQIVMVVGGIFAIIGICSFQRRELATAQR